MVEELILRSNYSKKAIEYYKNKVNVGTLENPSVSTIYTGICGDIMKIYLKIRDNVVEDAKFQALGCPGALASGSAVTKIIKGKSLDEARKITEKDVLNELDGLPESKLHCAKLAALTLQQAISEYEKV